MTALEQDVTILARKLWTAREAGLTREANRCAAALNALLLFASGFEPDAETATDEGQHTFIGGLEMPAAA